MNRNEAIGRVTLTLYGRCDCHLCDGMMRALSPWLDRLDLAVKWEDVDADTALIERYGDRVPVLVLDDEEICHYFLDETALLARMEGPR